MPSFPPDVTYQYTLHGSRLVISPKAQKKLDEIGLNEKTNWATYNSGQQITKGTTSCYKVALHNSDKSVFFKRYHIHKQPWEFFIRRSKAANELVSFQHLKKIGISTLDVIAFYEKREFFRLDTAAIITKEVENSLDLKQFAKKVWLNMPKHEKAECLKQITSSLFSQLRKAHKARFFHLDLKWRNILIQKTNPESDYKTIWIDCPRGQFMRLRWRRGMVADLSALARMATFYFSRSQQMRLLKKYLDGNENRIDCKELFKEIAEHLARRPPAHLLLDKQP